MNLLGTLTSQEKGTAKDIFWFWNGENIGVRGISSKNLSKEGEKMKKKRVDKNISRRQMLQTLGKASVCMGAYPLARNLLGSRGFAWAGETKPKYLVYGDYGGDYGKWMQEAYGDPFTKKTGIELKRDIGDNPDRLAKLRLQRDNPKHDIAQFMDRFFAQATAEGVVDTLNPDNIKNLKDVHPGYIHDTWVSYMAMSIGIVYNTKYVTKEIKSWNDIFDDAFRGRTFIDDIPHFGLHALMAFAKLKGGGEDNIDPGFKLLSKFKKITNPRIISSSQEGMKVFETGEVWIAVWQKARSIILMRQGLPIKFVSPIEGDVAISWAHGVVKGSKHKEWAEKYIDETLDPVNQLKFTTMFPGFPTNRKVKLPPELEVVGYTDEELARQHHIDYAKVLPQIDEWVERWNKEIAR